MGSREDSAREKMAELVDVEGRSDYEVEVLCRQFILAMDAIERAKKAEVEAVARREELRMALRFDWGTDLDDFKED